MSKEEVKKEEEQKKFCLDNQMIMNIFNAFDIAIKSPGTDHNILFHQKFAIQEALVKEGIIEIK
jgi:hypothetical protein